MATARHHHDESSPSNKIILSIRDDLAHIFDKMNKNEKYCPDVQELEVYATKIIRFYEKYADSNSKSSSYLKNAIIDLTEIPVMHPNLQRIAIKTVINEAIKNIDHFCHSHS